MLRKVLLFNLILCPWALSMRRQYTEQDSDELGSNFITSLRNDANLDLSMDEEYEDLRAELLAYHTALSSLAGSAGKPTGSGSLPPDVAQAIAMEPGNQSLELPETRRSMKTTPCWQLSGICVNHKLCEGHRFLTEVPGCKDKLEVCCFTWNNFEMKDLSDRGVKNLVFPWSNSYKFGGKGLIGSRDFTDNDEKPQGLGQVYVSSIELSKKKQKKPKKSHNKHDNFRKQRGPIVLVLRPDKK